MRLGILIRDTEYRDALARKLSSYDNDIFVNILDDSSKETSGSLILTDIGPNELDDKVLKAIKGRTVFISDSYRDHPKDCHMVFKYGSVSSLLAELSFVYNEWHGTGPGRNYSARILSVCCETDAYSASKCSALARQIIYRHGGRVLILPLAFINDHGSGENSSNTISKLLYSLQTGRGSCSESFTFTDSYGVSGLMLPQGRNPVAYIDEEELKSLVSGLATQFDTIICDVGTCFRNENIRLMKESDHIIMFETGRRVIAIEEMIGIDSCKKIMRIRLTGEADEAIAIDDCIKQIFSSDSDDSFKSGNDTKIRI